MDLSLLAEKLALLDQETFFSQWLLLSKQEKLIVYNQLLTIDLKQWQRLKKSLHVPLSQINPPFESMQPIKNRDLSLIIAEAGHRAIANGTIGCLVVAGGQGTRLGFNGPKGAFPLTPKSLFELLAEKVAKANILYNRQLPVALMTSPLNDCETRSYFDEKGVLELIPEVQFFVQGTLPLLTEEEKLFLTPEATLAEGPDGNGSALAAFYTSGLWTRWKEQGVKAVHFIQIDNPLADPYDALLSGQHLTEHNAITVKCIKRRDPDEPVGILIQKEERIHVLEYSEISPEERYAVQREGELKHPYANISTFCFSMEFIQKVAVLWQEELPLHIARKKSESLKLSQQSRSVESITALKGENFIFDVLPLAQRVQCVEYPREECFAPLKNLTGPDSPETVVQALMKKEINL